MGLVWPRLDICTRIVLMLVGAAASQTVFVIQSRASEGVNGVTSYSQLIVFAKNSGTLAGKKCFSILENRERMDFVHVDIR